MKHTEKYHDHTIITNYEAPSDPFVKGSFTHEIEGQVSRVARSMIVRNDDGSVTVVTDTADGSFAARYSEGMFRAMFSGKALGEDPFTVWVQGEPVDSDAS